ncbi:hypothetical protein Tcan_07356 [Toxocara canis]|uniref:G-protein coupled receptors family 1 profile domain-containing protein n=1 Tax=Toxocara canis TaxID=6265 RepID=A0A0B2VDL2_TOXCA|nr:hypothetical protein Tcan_07356 [Toxocara canis]
MLHFQESYAFHRLTHFVKQLRLREKLLYPICVYFLPLVVISVLNFRILSILNRERINAEGRNLGKEKRSIRLLTAVVILFFFCHTGGLVIRFFADDEEYSEQFVLAKDVVNLLFNINSLANPLLYFVFTRQFKDLREARRQGAQSAPRRQLLCLFVSNRCFTDREISLQLSPDCSEGNAEEVI